MDQILRDNGRVEPGKRSPQENVPKICMILLSFFSASSLIMAVLSFCTPPTHFFVTSFWNAQETIQP
jgi:hypothetical protein